MNKGRNHVLTAVTLLVVAIVATSWFRARGACSIQSDGCVYYEYFTRMVVNNNLAGSGLIKFPIGTTLLQLPFLLTANWCSSAFGMNPKGGFGFMFQYAVFASAVFWSLVALVLVYRWLTARHSRLASLLACFSLLFGTMLPVYITDKASFSHAYGFFACSAFWVYVPWYESVRGKSSSATFFIADLALGALLGLCVIVRNTNIIIGAAYLLYGVCSLKDFSERLRGKILTMRLVLQIAGALTIFAIQMLAWRLMAGHWVLYSYAGESFTNFAHPHFLRVLFSDAKGLFIFCPILLVAIVSQVVFKKECEEYCLAQWIVFAGVTFIIGAWWCWWLGMAYGERLFCDVLCIFALPLAVYYEKLQEWMKDLSSPKKMLMCWMPCLGYALACLFIILNLTFIYGVAKGQVNDNLATWFELKTWLSDGVFKSGKPPKLGDAPFDIFFQGPNYNADKYVLCGIGKPGAHWTWSSGTRMEVKIPVKSSYKDFDIRIYSLSPFNGSKRWIVRQRDTILCEGALDSDGYVQFLASAQRGWLSFSVEFPDAERPCDIDPDSHDDRLLSLRLRQIRIGPHRANDAE